MNGSSAAAAALSHLKHKLQGLLHVAGRDHSCAGEGRGRDVAIGGNKSDKIFRPTVSHFLFENLEKDMDSSLRIEDTAYYSYITGVLGNSIVSRVRAVASIS